MKTIHGHAARCCAIAAMVSLILGAIVGWANFPEYLYCTFMGAWLAGEVHDGR